MSTPAAENSVEKLARLIEEAYRLFGESSPATGTISTCPCCVGEEFEKEINATPLRELTTDQIGIHGQSAYQRAVDIRYMVPRVFELIASGEDPIGSTFDFYINWDAEGGDWRSWPVNEKELLHELASACFDVAFDWPIRPLGCNPGQACEMLLALDLSPMERIKELLKSGDPARVAGVGMLLRSREGSSITFDFNGDYAKVEQEVTRLLFSEMAVETLRAASRATDDPKLIEVLSYLASLAELHSAPHWVVSALPEPDWGS